MDLEPDGGISIFDFPVFANNFAIGVTFPTTLVSQISVAAPFMVPVLDEPKRQEEKASRVLEHPLDRQLAVAAFPAVGFRLRGGEAKVLDADAELPDLEEVLEEIGADVFSAWRHASSNRGIRKGRLRRC